MGGSAEGYRSLAGALTGRERFWHGLTGLVPASVVTPLILNLWSPTWFAISWLVAYSAISAFFLRLSLGDSTNRIEQAWSIIIAVLYCGVPISAVLWSDQPEYYWASALVVIVVIAFEMSNLPFARVGEWRVGSAILGLTLAICGLTTINPFVSLSFIPLIGAMVNSAGRVRKLKEELELHLETAEHTSLHDPLTAIFNRRGLDSVLIALRGQPITMALIDIDRFKLVNDTYGHQLGDQVLVALTGELRQRLGDRFQLARLGGDEFVAIAPGLVSIAPSLTDPVRVTAALRGLPITIECGLSVGVSSGMNDDSANRLLTEAGFAMRHAKRSASGIEQFGDELEERLNRTMEFAAIGGGTNGELVPFGQTVVAEDQIVGCELLIRWQQTTGEILPPDKFLPLAAEVGLMPTVNELMLESAVRFAARFNNRADGPFVAVNISAPYLSGSFCTRVEALLIEHQVHPERLMIEVTETEQFGSDRRWESAAAELRGLGVKLAMDDFGTGYSSIDRLQHLPISHLKFDRSLVQSVSGPFGQIVRGVAQFAQAVQIGVIAEGIETPEELEIMRSLGVSMFQGYLFDRPEPLDQLEIKIIENRSRQVAVPSRHHEDIHAIDLRADDTSPVR